jgi:two-component system sensor histidine kinase RpfC
MADLCATPQLNREQADMLQTLRGSSRVMLGLIEDVLDFSKIEAGKVVLERTDFDLHALVNSTCRILAAQARRRASRFVVSIDAGSAARRARRRAAPSAPGADQPGRQRGSVHRARQRHGACLGAVETEQLGAPQVPRIRDTGIGIAPTRNRRSSMSFTQADQSTTRRFGGTGLGTTIAKQLVG